MAKNALDLNKTVTIKLRAAAWEDFIRTIERPPEPNKALAKLLRRHTIWK